ncbi:MAG: sigma-70 family RNA polymerase sigma factor [Sedimentisphaerales bacterium]|nr:sigma-70 family RNA polymerase sigma factor [Sedimentisphaerales bacterium]
MVISQKVQAKIDSMPLSAVQKKNVEEIMAKPVTYIANKKFARPSVMKNILDHEVMVLPGTPLEAEDEQVLFLQMNYRRYLISQRRGRLLKRGRWNLQEILELEDCYNLQMKCRSNIVTHNMGLVLAMAKRSNFPGVEFTDLVSEGSMALLRATEKFDCERGFKFSTYACQAILKSFARPVKQYCRYRKYFPVQWDTTMDKDVYQEDSLEDSRREWIEALLTIMNKNLAGLSDVEKNVVDMRFSLNDHGQKMLTLEKTGEKLGLSKERIRQIQNQALSKLRSATWERMVPCKK